MPAVRDIFLPCSDNPANTWCLTYYKPQRGPGAVTAREGQLREEPTCRAFTCDFFNCRSFKQELAGRATKKAIARAYVNVVRQMITAEVLEAKAVERLLANLQAV